MLKFYSKPVSEHSEVPLADAGELEAQVLHFEARKPPDAMYPSGHGRS